jgi:(1->4)-alpha-D-glucan 1-alpha-D-glucosylmutase
MIASYRLQLQPDFGFDQVRALLPYFRRLGVSHLYLSPITEARKGSPHGYDVVDHNRIRDELGGPDGFWSLVKAARRAGLALIVDFVPNHAGVGARNGRWQDVLAYGPLSQYARHFDIDWQPLKPELRNKILLPYLGAPYGQTLDTAGISLVHEEGRISAASGDNRFALAPSTYGEVLEAVVQVVADGDSSRALGELAESFRRLQPQERGKADLLRHQLAALAKRIDLRALLARIDGARLHALLERQFWRLSYWKTAASEINYRRFFDVNDLVGLRMQSPDVFEDTHRLLSTIVNHDGIEGVRIDHIDGLFDPHDYLLKLAHLGARRIWVEKIVARGETIPADWPVEGTVGYEFLNDVLGVLTWRDGEQDLDRVCRRFVPDALPFDEAAYQSKRLVVNTTLAGELSQLAYGLDRISEGDYHTRDFTLEALREALAEIIAAFPRYRTYLPHDSEEGQRIIRSAVHDARRRNPGAEPTVYDFIAEVLLGRVSDGLRDAAAAWVGRFQQYTAPVAGKGVEDTAFYRDVRLVALNEVGGEPDRFGLPAEAFHARARFRTLRYVRTLLATATHDHKRGEDTRVRLIVLAELSDAWKRTVGLLSRLARRHRSSDGPGRADEYLFYQTLVTLWPGADRQGLAERLAAYMRKAAREAKRHTSWLAPDASYETALERFVRGMIEDGRVARAVEPLARALAHYGFMNTLSQVVLKLTSPGVPDFYQGSELLDLSLVDPDNRRPVDFSYRARLLGRLEPLLSQPDVNTIRSWIDASDERAKFYVILRTLRFRQAHPDLFLGGYRPIEAEGPRAQHVLAYARETDDEALVVIVPRYMVTLDRLGGWGETRLPLPEMLSHRTWTDVLTEQPLSAATTLGVSTLPLPWAVLFTGRRSPEAPAPGQI